MSSITLYRASGLALLLYHSRQMPRFRPRLNIVINSRRCIA